MDRNNACEDEPVVREIPDVLAVALQVFKGDDSVSRRQRHSEAECCNISFTVRQGLGVLQAIVHRHLQQTLGARYGNSEASNLVLKIKPSTVAPQSRFIPLDESNFDELIHRSFSQALVRQQMSPDEVRIPLSVYISETATVGSRFNRSRVGTTGTIRRATQERIREAASEIADAVRQNVVNVGPNSRVGEIATRVWAMSRAREPNAVPIETAPSNNTFRQAARLDFIGSQAENNPSSEWTELPLRLNGSEIVTAEVHVPTLRSILGLPPFPLFNEGIFHNDPLPTEVGQDIEDLDHRSDSS